jgi:DNA mismatch endonuclease, patch repair protein
MSDVFSKEKRSEVMSKIRGKGNKDTELKMIAILKENHISGWRRNQKVFGKPDFVFWNKKVAMFVDGCFWHCCPSHSTTPKNNKEFWEKKLQSNITRDSFVNQELIKTGWKVIRIWEHELSTPNIIAEKIKSQLLR